MSQIEDLLFMERELKMPLTPLPVRSTFVRLGERGVLISPLPGFKKHISEIKNFANVTDIIAPNCFHNLGIKTAHEFFPQATIWYAKGLEKKLPHFPWQKSLEESNWPYKEELPLFQIKGAPKYSEVVFYHKKTKTLLVSDLCFNLKNRKDFGAKIVYGVFGTLNKLGISRLVLLLTKDKKAFRESLKPIFNLDFENVVMAHGEIIMGNAKESLKAAFLERGIKV
ncbi:MAG: DUF4336 domain-containing protein [Bdellovibrionales bacterium]|nr:DUF4336 domain-containing protein [Bdellovibrionales bacterium]